MRFERIGELVEEDPQIAVSLAQHRGQRGFAAAALDGRKEFLLLDLHMLLDPTAELGKGGRSGVPLRRADVSRRRIEGLL
jgi:hypothetical protein